MFCFPTCQSVETHPLPSVSYRDYNMFEISASKFGTMVMHRQFRACTYESLTTVTVAVVHAVHKVVIWPSFCVIQ